MSAASPRASGVLPVLRRGGLSLLALFLAHDALYVVRFGIGDALAQGMTRSGHEGWWTPYAMVVAAVAAVLVMGAAWRMRALGRIAAGLPGLERSDRRACARDAAALLCRLLPAVLLLLLVQENVEHFVTEGRLAGLEPFASPLAVGAVVAATSLVALAAALVRWRIRGLEARVRSAGTRYPRPARAGVPGHALLVAAGVLHRWLLCRDDPGRAPPLPSH